MIGHQLWERLRHHSDDSTAPEREADAAPKLEPEARDHSHSALPISGDDLAVDHTRAPGVPPSSAHDYDDMVDIEGAESFPASDPPSGW